MGINYVITIGYISFPGWHLTCWERCEIDFIAILLNPPLCVRRKAYEDESLSPREPDRSEAGNTSSHIILALLLVVADIEGGLLLSPVEAASGTCGNGVVDKFEQCDDGNSENGDGCSSFCQEEGDDFPVMVYTINDPPPTPALEELPLLTQATQHGITWTFARTCTS
jgi:cysteine-rich repeat protein